MAHEVDQEKASEPGETLMTPTVCSFAWPPAELRLASAEYMDRVPAAWNGQVLRVFVCGTNIRPPRFSG
jgi:hypothetical protein